MLRPTSFTIPFIVTFVAKFLVTTFLGGGLSAQPVHFDCPAITAARLVELQSDQKVIEFRVPISMTVLDNHLTVDSLRTEIGWNRVAYPLVSYGPSTLLKSRYDGPVSVERKTETNASLDSRVSSSYLEFVSPSLNGNLNKKKSETRKFNEIPEHELVIGSGPVQRGTGAYFLFKPTRTETLEGGREVVLAYRVPISWSGGLLQVTMTVSGQESKKLGLFREDVEFARIFVLPAFLEGDLRARQAAQLFANSEQRLRKGWSLHLAESSKPNSTNIFRWFDKPDQQADSLWMHHLIQSGSDLAIKRYESKLPRKISSVAYEFVQARRDLIELSR